MLTWLFDNSITIHQLPAHHQPHQPPAATHHVHQLPFHQLPQIDSINHNVVIVFADINIIPQFHHAHHHAHHDSVHQD